MTFEFSFIIFYFLFFCPTNMAADEKRKIDKRNNAISRPVPDRKSVENISPEFVDVLNCDTNT